MVGVRRGFTSLTSQSDRSRQWHGFQPDWRRHLRDPDDLHRRWGLSGRNEPSVPSGRRQATAEPCNCFSLGTPWDCPRPLKCQLAVPGADIWPIGSHRTRTINCCRRVSVVRLHQTPSALASPLTKATGRTRLGTSLLGRLARSSPFAQRPSRSPRRGTRPPCQLSGQCRCNQVQVR